MCRTPWSPTRTPYAWKEPQPFIMIKINQHWSHILLLQFLVVFTPMTMIPFMYLHIETLAAPGQNVAYWTSISSSMPSFSALLGMLLWSKVTDKIHSSYLLIIGCTICSIGYFIQSSALSPEVFAIGRIIQGASCSPIFLLIATVRIQKNTKNARFIGLYQAAGAGCLLGPIIGGIIFEYNALNILLRCASITFLSLALFIYLNIKNIDHPHTTTSSLTDLKPRKISEYLPRRYLICLIAVTLSVAGAFGFRPFFALWVIQKLGDGIQMKTIGAINSLSWLIGILVLPLWSKISSSFASIYLSLSVSAFTLFSQSFSQSLSSITTLNIIQASAYAGLEPSLYSNIRHTNFPEKNLIIARITLVLGQIIGPLICGLSFPLLGVSGILLLSASLPLIGCIILMTQEFHSKYYQV